MKRAVLVSGDFVRTGGMDMPNFALALHLANRGVSVEIAAHRIAEELALHPNVHWHRVPKPLNSYFLGAPFLDRIGRRMAGKGAPPDSRVVVNGGNCQVGDINWVHYLHAAYEPKRAAPFAARIKGHVDRRLALTQERSALKMAGTIVVNSQRTRRDLTTLLGLDEARIRTIYYGIDPARFFPASEERRRTLRAQFAWPDRPQLAFIGALGDRRKGFDTLFGAWASLCKTPSWDSDLLVVGSGAELPFWKERAEAYGLADRIRFLGFRKDVPDLLAACDALIAPTRYEAFGLGVHEALCTGLPALVSEQAGVSELYPPELGVLLLSDVNSQAALEKSLLHWRQNSDHLRAQTVVLSTVLRQRTWETMASEIAELLS